jgi:hypothetical protein
MSLPSTLVMRVYLLYTLDWLHVFSNIFGMDASRVEFLGRSEAPRAESKKDVDGRGGLGDSRGRSFAYRHDPPRWRWSLPRLLSFFPALSFTDVKFLGILCGLGTALNSLASSGRRVHAPPISDFNFPSHRLGTVSAFCWTCSCKIPTPPRPWFSQFSLSVGLLWG